MHRWAPAAVALTLVACVGAGGSEKLSSSPRLIVSYILTTINNATVDFEGIREHLPTILINVPTVVNQMVSHPQAAQQDLGSVRFATSAGVRPSAMVPNVSNETEATMGTR